MADGMPDHRTDQLHDPANYRFEPPLRIKGRSELLVHSLDEAERFLLDYDRERLPIHNRKGILRKLQAASRPEEQKNAADAFIGWLEAERLLLDRTEWPPADRS